mgnify:FL=1
MCENARTMCDFAQCAHINVWSKKRVSGLSKFRKKIKFGGSALAAEICAGPRNRLLRRQHCSSLCSQSEGHEHVANMTSAPEHDFVVFSARVWPPQYSSPSLCEQSELQCFAPELRHTLLFSKKRRFFEILNTLPFQGRWRLSTLAAPH